MFLKTAFLPCLMFFSLKRSSFWRTAPDCVTVQRTTPWCVWIIPVAPQKSVVRSTEKKAAIPKVIISRKTKDWLAGRPTECMSIYLTECWTKLLINKHLTCGIGQSVGLTMNHPRAQKSSLQALGSIEKSCTERTMPAYNIWKQFLFHITVSDYNRLHFESVIGLRV